MAPILSDYLTRDQLAAELGVTVRSLEKWTAQRLGPPVTKVGRRALYRRSAVSAWLAKREKSWAA